MFTFIKEIFEGLAVIAIVLVIIGAIILAPILGAFAFFVTLIILAIASLRGYQLDRRKQIKMQKSRGNVEDEQ